ncbi:S1 family peptidase, partial [Streptosporangium sp. NPDC048865]|uniref:S1 family peptidase n=1 Tax=Streptosporangium sp. NPDC048865 TaxID=3155766 RepID=UPI003432B2CC
MSAKPPAGVLEAVVRDLGLTEDEARTRLLNEIRLTPIAANLRRKLGDRFAGAWLLPPHAQTLVVATTDSADTFMISERGARPLVVGRSLADLERVRERLNHSAPGLAKLSSVRYVGVRVNKIVILTSSPEAVRKAVEAAGVDRGAVEVTASAERP